MKKFIVTFVVVLTVGAPIHVQPIEAQAKKLWFPYSLDSRVRFVIPFKRPAQTWSI